jgi:hypothetical protein
VVDEWLRVLGDEAVKGVWITQCGHNNRTLRVRA